MRTPEEILDYHMHQKGKHTVGLHESDLYECAINAIKEALTISQKKLDYENIQTN